MADIPRIDSVPMTCPQCAAESGFPYRAETIPDSVNVELSLRCHACRHEWAAVFTSLQQPVRRPIRQHAAS